MDAQGKRMKIALATYTPLEYRKLLATAIDASGLDRTWEEWLNSVEHARIQFTAMGYECVGVAIQIDALERYCREHGLENNGAARAAYASFLLEQQGQRQLTHATKRVKGQRKR